MPDIFLYDVAGSNPNDVILTDPTVLNPNVHVNVRPAGNGVRLNIGGIVLAAQINVLLYAGEANPTDVMLRSIGFIGGSVNVDVNATGNLLTAFLGSVSVIGDANISLTGNLFTAAVGTATASGAAAVIIGGGGVSRRTLYGKHSAGRRPYH